MASYLTLMPSPKERIQGFLKGRPQSKPSLIIGALDETTRNGLHKQTSPQYYYKAPFGYPRLADMNYIRWIARTPYAQMCIKTIIDELKSVQWDVIVKEDVKEKHIGEDGEVSDKKKEEIKHLKSFLENPNTNHETFNDVFISKWVRDILEVNAGVLVKVFNLEEKMVEVVNADGATFTKNPDIHGMYTDRAEIVSPLITSVQKPGELTIVNPSAGIGGALQDQRIMDVQQARKLAAYFQYGIFATPGPVPFGKREIVWLARSDRTNDYYGFSPVQTLAKSLQTLIYMVDSDLDYYNNNNVPKGIVGLDGSDSGDIKSFQQMWNQEQYELDEFGQWKKKTHQILFLNNQVKFERFELTADEMKVIEKQKWYGKMVWACFGVTATELGYTEDASGQANQIVQSNVFRKKTINPLLRQIEQAINRRILPEFGYDDLEFKFTTFDVDEEMKKYDLYALQTNSAPIITINEIRHKEGLKEIEGGDELFFGGMSAGIQEEDEAEANKLNDEQEETSTDMQNPKKKDESKALTANPSNPLILGENERASPDKLKEAIHFILNLNKDKIKEALKKEGGADILKQIKETKDIERVLTLIRNLFSIEGLKSIVNAVIKGQFNEGWDKTEQELNQNFIPDQNAINFIQNYTFDNIKAMTEEVADDLRAELQRGFMAGEGIPKLSERVEKVFNVGKNRAEIISITEANRASNFGQLGAWKTSGIKGTKVWLSTKDDRTSAICKRLDGQEVDINKNFKDSKTGQEVPAPPIHPRCRSTLNFIPED